MNISDQPLTEAEWDELDDFLLYRGKEEIDKEYREGFDEGILDVLELDGFLTAIVSGPEAIMPSRWLPAVWGDDEPVWNTEEEFNRIMTLMMRQMNQIVAILMAPTVEFEPFFMERIVEDKTYTIVDEWCEGYMRGVALSGQSWQPAQEDIGAWLADIRFFTVEESNDYSKLTEKEMLARQSRIAVAARHIHGYWLERRSDTQTAQTVVHDEPKVGRNDPCPCGSGKKFKKCCLH